MLHLSNRIDVFFVFMAKITNHTHHEELYCVIDQILSVQFKIVGGRQGLWIGLGVTVKETGSGVVGVGGH